MALMPSKAVNIYRLRYLRNAPKPFESGGPNDYQRLFVSEFSQEPKMTRPQICTDEQELEDFVAAKLDGFQLEVKHSLEQKTMTKANTNDMISINKAHLTF